MRMMREKAARNTKLFGETGKSCPIFQGSILLCKGTKGATIPSSRHPPVPQVCTQIVFGNIIEMGNIHKGPIIC